MGDSERAPAHRPLRACSRWTDLAQTPGVPRVSHSVVLAAVPAGHVVRPEAGRSAALGSQPLGFVIASPAFPPSAGPTSARPPSIPRRAEQQARGPGVAEPPPAVGTPGSGRIPHPKTTGPSACLPKPLAGAPSGSAESDSDFHRKTPYWPLGLLPFPSPSG